MNHYPSSTLLCSIILLTVLLLTGCVTPIPLAQEAPDLSYNATQSIVVAVIDDRDIVKEGKPPTYIGRAHGSFGIPSDMQTYPWFVSDKEKKKQTLAQALEERIVVGLNDDGWRLTSAGVTKAPVKDDVRSLLAVNDAQRLLVLSITQWFASINLNWVTAFNFDWGYKLNIFDKEGVVLASITDSGRDVVDEEAKQSHQNMIKMAYRTRLIKILERPEVKAALNKSTKQASSYTPSEPRVDKTNHKTSKQRDAHLTSEQQVSKPSYEKTPQLRAMNAMDKRDCEFINSVRRSAGGTGDVSGYVKQAMSSALTEAANINADSYYLVSTNTTDSGATVILEALRCE